MNPEPFGKYFLLERIAVGGMAEIYRAEDADLVMLTSPEPLPGVVVRDGEGRIQRIVELTDATPEEAEIRAHLERAYRPPQPKRR